MGFNSGFKGLMKNSSDTIGNRSRDHEAVYEEYKMEYLQLQSIIWHHIFTTGIPCKICKHVNSGPGSVAGITTRYGLDVRGLNPSGGEIFLTSPDWPWGPPSLLYNGYRVFPWGKERSGRDADPSPPSSAVGHETVELYLYSPCGLYGMYRASVPVQGCTFLNM